MLPKLGTVREAVQEKDDMSGSLVGDLKRYVVDNQPHVDLYACTTRSCLLLQTYRRPNAQC